MSLYFTLLFAYLTLEMAILFTLVLPLPNRVRKGVYKVWRTMLSRQEYKTVFVILGIIVGLLFADSWKRANVPINLYGHGRGHGFGIGSRQKAMDDRNGDPYFDPISSFQAVASRSYNQRNVYISGFILYFMIGIPTVMSIVRRLIKYQDLIDQKNKDAKKTATTVAVADAEIVTDTEIEELEKTLKLKDISLQGLKKQVDNLESHIDATQVKTEKDSNIVLKKND